MAYVAKRNGALAGGTYKALKKYSEAELKAMNNGNKVDKDYLKSNFQTVSANSKTKVDDPEVIKDLQARLFARKINFKADATQSELEKLLKSAPELPKNNTLDILG